MPPRTAFTTLSAAAGNHPISLADEWDSAKADTVACTSPSP